MKPLISVLLAGALLATVPGCAQLFDKDNTPKPKPLTRLPANATSVSVLWHTSTGGGASADYLRLTPVLHGSRLFTASTHGQVTAIDPQTGNTLWQTQTGIPVSAGVTVAGQHVLVGGRNGVLVALDETTGKILWQAHASSEILAPPATTPTRVVVKSIDGHVTAFSAQSGKQLWSAFDKQPELILHGSSSPRIAGNSVFAGFEDGTLARYNLTTGRQQWRQTVATPTGIFPITRMVDIDSDPVVAGNHLFTAAWQGRVARLDTETGHIEWTQPVSTYTALAHDGRAVYLSDAKGTVHAFAAHSGKTLWTQPALEARVLTGPALAGQTLVVGDAEGWVHFLNKQNGQLVTRYKAGGGGIFATPLVAGNTIYLLTRDGQLTACRITT